MNRKNSRDRGRRKQLAAKRKALQSFTIRQIRKEMREALNEILGHGWKNRRNQS